MQLRKVAEFYRRLFGGEQVRAPTPYNIQISLNFRDFLQHNLAFDE